MGPRDPSPARDCGDNRRRLTDRGTSTILPTKWVPMMLSLTSSAPSSMSPRAASTASLADVAVPVADRSSLPGATTVALRASPPSRAGAVNTTNERTLSAGSAGCEIATCSATAGRMRSPSSARTRAHPGRSGSQARWRRRRRRTRRRMQGRQRGPRRRDLDRHIETSDERRNVLECHLLAAAFAALGHDPHQAGRSLERHPRHRLSHRHHPRLQKHRGRIDRVGARHPFI